MLGKKGTKMTDSLFKINRGVSLTPQSGIPASPTDGDMYYDASLGSFVFYGDGKWMSLADRQDVASATDLTSAQLTAAKTQAPFIRITGSTLTNLHGMAAAPDGRQILVYNDTGLVISILHDSATEGTAANRIKTSNTGTISIRVGTAAIFAYDAGSSCWRAISIGSRDSGNASTFQGRLEDELVDSPYEFLTPNIFSTAEQTLADGSTTASFNFSDLTYDFTVGEFFLSANMCDPAYLASGRTIPWVDLTVSWLVAPTTATYEISQDGATWEVVSMSRVGTSDTFTGSLCFVGALDATPTLRVRITVTVGTGRLTGFGTFYGYTGAVSSTNVKPLEVFTFDGTTNPDTFTLTKFLPDPDLLCVYEVERGAAISGKVYRYGNFTLSGYQVIFPAGTFNTAGTCTLHFNQLSGSGFDNADVNAAVIAANHLGSESATLDRSIDGRGLYLRRPDGTLCEVTVSDLNTMVVTPV